MIVLAFVPLLTVLAPGNVSALRVEGVVDVVGAIEYTPLLFLVKSVY